MEITIYGVRGSIPTPGNEFSRFGGNTSCTEILHKDFQIIVDAGTGFKSINIRKDVPVLVLFSHFHHDHIQGLPFCRDLLTLKVDALAVGSLLVYFGVHKAVLISFPNKSEKKELIKPLS